MHKITKLNEFLQFILTFHSFLKYLIAYKFDLLIYFKKMKIVWFILIEIELRMKKLMICIKINIRYFYTVLNIWFYLDWIKKNWIYLQVIIDLIESNWFTPLVKNRTNINIICKDFIRILIISSFNIKSILALSLSDPYFYKIIYLLFPSLFYEFLNCISNLCLIYSISLF